MINDNSAFHYITFRNIRNWVLLSHKLNQINLCNINGQILVYSIINWPGNYDIHEDNLTSCSPKKVFHTNFQLAWKCFENLFQLGVCGVWGIPYMIIESLFRN